MSFFNDDSASFSGNEPSSGQSDITITDSNTIITTSTSSSSSRPDFSTSIPNQPGFKMDSSAYIFKNDLFTKTLLPIDPTKERQILLQCTT